MTNADYTVNFFSHYVRIGFIGTYWQQITTALAAVIFARFLAKGQKDKPCVGSEDGYVAMTSTFLLSIDYLEHLLPRTNEYPLCIHMYIPYLLLHGVRR